jgi:hypothetical protein
MRSEKLLMQLESKLKALQAENDLLKKNLDALKKKCESGECCPPAKKKTRRFSKKSEKEE